MRFAVCVVILLLVPPAFSQPENDGPFRAGWTSQTLLRGSRSLACRIYYPATAEGSETPADSTGGYPIIAFGHGFFMQTGYYLSHFRHLATHGFVVIAPQFPDTQHEQLADDLLFCVDYMRQQASVPSSRFHRLIDTSAVGLSGHSMGGGASLLAAARDSRVDVVAPLAAAETNPSAINIMNRIAAVVYLISGGSDGITPLATHQQPMYQQARPVKALPVILQANHTRFMDTNLFDFTDPNGTLSRPQQLLITRRYLTSVFHLILKKQPDYWAYAFGDSARSDPSLTFSSQPGSLAPAPFRLQFPDGNTWIPLLERFIWHSSRPLNPADSVSYLLEVARDSLFNNIILSVPDLQDTSYRITQVFEPYVRHFWRVTARTSDSTKTRCERVFVFSPLLTHVREPRSRYTFRLEQNYPNPFNPATTITIEVPAAGFVTLKVYDMIGREVATLVNGELAAGKHERRFSPEGLASGMYFYRMQSGGFSSTRTMLLQR